MSRYIAILFAALLGVVAATARAPAQSPPWDAVTGDTGTWVYGYARQPGLSVEFGCTAPSRQGLPAFQTGSHEMMTAEAFQLIIRLPETLFHWTPPYWQRGTWLIVNDVRHVLPDFQLNELQGTSAIIAMDSPLGRALFGARRLALVTPHDMTHAQTTDGLAGALRRALAPCVARWVEMGYALPTGLAPLLAPSPAAGIPRFQLGGAPSQAPQPAPQSGAGGIPRFSLSGASRVGQPAATPATTIAELPPTIPAHIRAQCGGQARIEDAALTHAGDLDGDNAPDYLIHYSGVFCQPGDLRGFCGAANCMVEVFISSRGYQRPFEFLAIDVTPETAPSGRVGLRMVATNFLCADGACDRLWLWNGQTFSQTP